MFFSKKRGKRGCVPFAGLEAREVDVLFPAMITVGSGKRGFDLLFLGGLILKGIWMGGFVFEYFFGFEWAFEGKSTRGDKRTDQWKNIFIQRKNDTNNESTIL